MLEALAVYLLLTFAVGMSILHLLAAARKTTVSGVVRAFVSERGDESAPACFGRIIFLSVCFSVFPPAVLLLPVSAFVADRINGKNPNGR